MQNRGTKKAILSWLTVAIPLVIGMTALAVGVFFVVVPETETENLAKLSQSVHKATTTEEANETSVDFNKLEQIEPNVSICNWITLESAGIDLPVVQANKDNPDYWLRHKLDGTWSISGIPYIDYRTNGDAAHVVVYGHNTGSSGGMFTRLHDTWKQTQFNEVLSGDAVWETKTLGKTKFKPLCAIRVYERYEPIQTFLWNNLDDYHTWLYGIADSSTAKASDWQKLVANSKRDICLVTCSAITIGQTNRTIVIFVED